MVSCTVSTPVAAEHMQYHSFVIASPTSSLSISMAVSAVAITSPALATTGPLVDSVNVLTPSPQNSIRTRRQFSGATTALAVPTGICLSLDVLISTPQWMPYRPV